MKSARRKKTRQNPGKQKCFRRTSKGATKGMAKGRRSQESIVSWRSKEDKKEGNFHMPNTIGRSRRMRSENFPLDLAYGNVVEKLESSRREKPDCNGLRR